MFIIPSFDARREVTLVLEYCSGGDMCAYCIWKIPESRTQGEDLLQTHSHKYNCMLAQLALSRSVEKAISDSKQKTFKISRQ